MRSGQQEEDLAAKMNRQLQKKDRKMRLSCVPSP
jgi:hypothetical protein